MGIRYDGPALRFEEIVKRTKDDGHDGNELDGERPHGNPMDLDGKTRERMRAPVGREGLEIPCVAANNDFSSPIPEHRECQLLVVRQRARLAADLGAEVVRWFAAWPGVVIRDGRATYDLVREGMLRAATSRDDPHRRTSMGYGMGGVWDIRDPLPRGRARRREAVASA